MLKITDLEKATTKKLLMANVNITLHPSEIFALVGEHKSGKSLLSKIILTLSNKTKGVIKIDVGNYVGAFIQKEAFMPKDTVLTIIRDYCSINQRSYKSKKVKNILTLLNIKHLINTESYKLTKSETDRLKIALPLMVRSDILILDAPFNNLTPKESKDLKVILKTLCDKFKTAIIVTALKMSEIEEFCDTIAIIDDGMIIAIQSYNKMIEKDIDHTKLSVTVAQPNYAAKIIETELKFQTKLCGDKVMINTTPDDAKKVVDKLTERNVTVFAVNKVPRTLEFQYLEILNNRKKFY